MAAASITREPGEEVDQIIARFGRAISPPDCILELTRYPQRHRRREHYLATAQYAFFDRDGEFVGVGPSFLHENRTGANCLAVKATSSLFDKDIFLIGSLLKCISSHAGFYKLRAAPRAAGVSAAMWSP
jgi:hypothetical protein